MQKSHPIAIIFHLVVATFASLLLMGVALEFTSHDLIIFMVGVLTFVITWFWLRKNKVYGYQVVKAGLVKAVGETSPKTKEEMNRPYKFIFTHSEKALDAIESTVSNHPKVIDVFQDSGYWYSNGETGPEWFSMHVRCKVEDSEEVQHFIDEALKKRGYAVAGNYMGSYN